MYNNIDNLLGEMIKKYNAIAQKLQQCEANKQNIRERWLNTVKLYETLVAGERKLIGSEDSKVCSNYDAEINDWDNIEKGLQEDINKMPQEEKEFCHFFLAQSMDDIERLAESNRNSLASFMCACLKARNNPEAAIPLLERVDKNAFYGVKCKALLELLQGIQLVETNKAEDKDSESQIKKLNKEINIKIERLSLLSFDGGLNQEKSAVISQLESVIKYNNECLRKLEAKKREKTVGWFTIPAAIVLLFIFEVVVNQVYIQRYKGIKGVMLGTPLDYIYNMYEKDVQVIKLEENNYYYVRNVKDLVCDGDENVEVRGLNVPFTDDEYCKMDTLTFQGGTKNIEINGEGKVEIQSIIIPEGVENISISWVKGINQLEIPKGVKKLEIISCPELAELTLLEGMESIELTNNKSLEKLTVSKNQGNIRVQYCENLEDIDFLGDIKKSVYFNNCHKINNLYFAGSIGDDVILNEVNIEHLSFSEDICASFHINGDCKNMNFAGDINNECSLCGKYENITFAEGIQVGGLNINDSTLSEIKIPESVVKLYVCDVQELQNLEVPYGVKEVWVINCESLTTLFLPNEMESLEIKGCVKLENVQIPEDVLRVDVDFEY